MSRFAVIAALFLGVAAVGGSSVATADEANAPQVSGKIAKLLKAAQDANAAKNYTEAVARLKEAQAFSPRSAYDDYVINSLLFQAYGGQNNLADATGPMEAVAASSYAPADTKLKLYGFLASSAYQAKNYDRAIEFAEKSRALGDTTETTALLIAQSNYLSGKFKEAAAAIVALNEKAQAAGKKPTENSLKLLWDCARQAKDENLASKTVEQLIVLYPNPVYWQNAMATALNGLTDDRLKLLTYRLANTVGILKRGDQFREMAQIALDQANPGEAQSLLEQAFAKNLYTEAREKESNQRLLDMAKKKALQDRASIGHDESDAAKAPTGDAYVQIGAAYLGFGMPDKAAAAIAAGISKGSLKYYDEAYILQGIAQERLKNNAEAIKSFEKVSKDPRYVRLAKLWILEVRS